MVPRDQTKGYDVDYLANEWALGVGRALRARRVTKGLTQTEVAEDVGVTRQAISLLERGRAFSMSAFIEVCLVLSVDPSSIWSQAKKILREQASEKSSVDADAA